MNGLKVQDFHGKQVIDSRDVAQNKQARRTIVTLTYGEGLM